MQSQLKKSGFSMVSAKTTPVPNPQLEKKTMFKVMDPNVHQTAIHKGNQELSDDEFAAERSSQKTVIAQGVEPKIEFMRRKRDRIVVGPAQKDDIALIREQVYDK